MFVAGGGVRSMMNASFLMLGAVMTQLATMDDGIFQMNRNARTPRKANHGKRPCCRYGRRKKLPRKKDKPIIKW